MAPTLEFFRRASRLRFDPRVSISAILHLPQVVREIYSGCSGPAEPECPPPPSSPVHKVELEKVRGVLLSSN